MRKNRTPFDNSLGIQYKSNINDLRYFLKINHCMLPKTSGNTGNNEEWGGGQNQDDSKSSQNVIV